MDRLGVGDADALREEIEKYDAAHVRTLCAYFNVEQEDALLYHIILNTDRVPVEACVTAISELAKSPKFQNPTRLHSALADKLLQARSIRRSRSISALPRHGTAFQYQSPRAKCSLGAHPPVGACATKRKK
jgi:hypothetical protein